MDHVLAATASALAYARHRSDPEVQVDDILLGALQVVARLGVVVFGGLTFDLSSYAPVPERNGSSGRGPRYAPDAAELFDRASSVARADGEAKVRLVHLLAAFSDTESSLLQALMESHDFDAVQWRAALLAWDRAAFSNDNSTPAKGDVLSVDDAAAALGVHAQTIRTYIRGGKLPAYRIAGERAIRVLASDLFGLLEPVEPSADPGAVLSDSIHPIQEVTDADVRSEA